MIINYKCNERSLRILWIDILVLSASSSWYSYEHCLLLSLILSSRQWVEDDDEYLLWWDGLWYEEWWDTLSVYLDGDAFDRGIYHIQSYKVKTEPSSCHGMNTGNNMLNSLIVILNRITCRDFLLTRKFQSRKAIIISCVCLFSSNIFPKVTTIDFWFGIKQVVYWLDLMYPTKSKTIKWIPFTWSITGNVWERCTF